MHTNAITSETHSREWCHSHLTNIFQLACKQNTHTHMRELLKNVCQRHTSSDECATKNTPKHPQRKYCNGSRSRMVLLAQSHRLQKATATGKETEVRAFFVVAYTMSDVQDFVYTFLCIRPSERTIRYYAMTIIYYTDWCRMQKNMSIKHSYSAQLRNSRKVRTHFQFKIHTEENVFNSLYLCLTNHCNHRTCKPNKQSVNRRTRMSRPNRTFETPGNLFRPVSVNLRDIFVSVYLCYAYLTNSSAKRMSNVYTHTHTTCICGHDGIIELAQISAER